MLIPVRADGGVAAQDRVGSRTRRIAPEAWLVLALTLAAAALRFATLGSQSLWFDEAQAVHELGGSLGSLLSAIGAQETSPPLYFLLGWVWVKLFGAGAVGLRSLSALLGVALVPLLYGCGRELVSRRAGLAAAALAAISPFMIWYSQEAREYMLLTVLCAASLLLYARADRQPDRRNLAGWALCSALALLTHFFAGFLVGAEALLLLARSRRAPTLVAVGAVVAVEGALVPLAISDTAHPLNWVTSFALSTRVQQVPVAFGMSMLYQSSLIRYGLAGAAVLAAVVILLVLAGAEGRQLRGAGLAAALAAVVLLVPLALALLGRDYYVPRVLMPAWPPLAVLLGAACTVRRPRGLGAALGLALIAMSLYAGLRIASDPSYQRPDWKAAATALGRPREARAVVAEAGSLATDPLKLYLPGAPWRQPTGALRVGELDVIGSALQSPARRLPAGVTLRSRRTVSGFLVLRFVSSSGWEGTAAQLARDSARLLLPPAAAPAVVIERP